MDALHLVILWLALIGVFRVAEIFRDVFRTFRGREGT